jgi:chemotaxis signal transduction protein
MVVDSHLQTSASAMRPGAVLLINIGERPYGLPVQAVERVLPMAYLLSLPDDDGGGALLGMLNLHGEVLPVINPHPRLGLPSPALTAEHRLVLLKANTLFLLWVDEAHEVVAYDQAAVTMVPVQHANQLVPWVLRLDDRIVPVLDPLSLEALGLLR